jgi:glutamate 5-kinase
VNENDTISFEEIQFGDNDNLSALIAQISEADLLLLLSDVEGLFDRDPKRQEPTHIIKRVEQIDEQIERLALGTNSKRSVGGMRSKIEAAKKAGYFGIPTRIVKGSEPDVIVRVLQGEELGTLFLPKQRLPRKKWWLAFAMRSKGRISIDDGAKEAILQKGKSLLPSGVKALRGEFLRGDCVELEDKDGRTVARGVVNYSSREIELIKGLKSIDIEGKLGYKYTDEIIHRDNMVIL